MSTNMTQAEIISKFRERNSPFYIVVHEDGSFALCHAFTFSEDDMTKKCQKAFDDYAISQGMPAVDAYGLHNYGSGDDWAEVFRQAFKDDPAIKRIQFDCEAGGFFCYTDDLQTLTDLGSRFYDICNDTNQFAVLLPPAMRLGEKRYCWDKVDPSAYSSVRDFFQKHPGAAVNIQTTEGSIKLDQMDTRLLLSDETTILSMEDADFPAKWLLDQSIGRMERNAADPNLYWMKAVDDGEQLSPVMSM